MEIRTWDTLEVFKQPIQGQNIRFQGMNTPKPEGLDESIRRNWDNQLKAKLSDLSKSGITAEIKPYKEDKSANPLNAIYEDEKAKMWPGPVISLMDFETIQNEGQLTVTLKVSQMFYPEIAALKDPEIQRLYQSQGLTIPRPALGVSTFLMTADELLTMTLRGIRTNQYPGRLYAPGGQPLFIDTDVVEHQVDEIKDEVNVTLEDYDPDSFFFGGIVVDTELLPRKPDLTGWIKVNLDAGDIKERVYSRKPEDRPNDVVDVVFAPAKESELMEYLIRRSHPLQYCPPTYAGLYVYGVHCFGKEWGKDLISKLRY